MIDVDDDNVKEYEVIEVEEVKKLDELDIRKKHIIMWRLRFEYFYDENESVQDLISKIEEQKLIQEIFDNCAFGCDVSKPDCVNCTITGGELRHTHFDLNCYAGIEWISEGSSGWEEPQQNLFGIPPIKRHWKFKAFKPTHDNYRSLLHLLKLQPNRWYDNKEIQTRNKYSEEIDACEQFLNDGIEEVTVITKRLHHCVDIFEEENKEQKKKLSERFKLIDLE